MAVNRIITNRRTIPLEQGRKGTNTYAGALRSLASHLINTGEDLDEALGRIAPLDMVVEAEKAQKVNAVKKALMQGRVGDVLTLWDRHHLRRVGEGESLSRWKADKLVEIGLITEDGKHLTHDVELALKQINSYTQ